MGRRKDQTTDEDPLTDSPGGAHKKHKKHKKKHKRKREYQDDESFMSDSTAEVTMDTSKQCIKLKIKFGGGDMLSTKSVPTVENKTILAPLREATSSVVENKGITKNPIEDTSDEEKQWLDALEAGELDDTGRIKQPKDPLLLTTRQRALFHGRQEHELLQLPSGYKTMELTEEQLERRQQRAKKRRLQAHEKREKDKKQTLERLLKKQDARLKGSKNKPARRISIPRILYCNTGSLISISVPAGFPYPLPVQGPIPPPKPRELCGARGCNNKKIYSCSKTGVPLCSLRCYKKNLSFNKARMQYADTEKKHRL